VLVCSCVVVSVCVRACVELWATAMRFAQHANAFDVCPLLKEHSQTYSTHTVYLRYMYLKHLSVSKET
jgi:hypothetical protein